MGIGIGGSVLWTGGTLKPPMCVTHFRRG